MIQVENLALVLTGIGLTASIVYYANILRNAERTKHRELVFSRLRMTKDFSEAYVTVANVMEWETPKEFFDIYRPDRDPVNYSTLIYLGGIYRNLGTLLKEKIADPDILFSVYGPSSIKRVWKKIEPVVNHWRILNNDPSMWSSFEYLYNEAVKRSPDSVVAKMEDFEKYYIETNP